MVICYNIYRTLEPMRFPISRVRYRSGPEWDSRFARRRSSVFEKDKDRQVDLNDALFAIEEYLGHQGKKWVGTYDPNSLLYLSKVRLIIAFIVIGSSKPMCR